MRAQRPAAGGPSVLPVSDPASRAVSRAAGGELAELAVVVPFVRPARDLGPAWPGLERGVDELTGTAPDALPPAGRPGDVLDAYARQPDEIAAVVEAWLRVLPDTAETRRYAAAVLHALGELHVALDTAAHLTRLRCQCRPDTGPRPGPLPGPPEAGTNRPRGGTDMQTADIGDVFRDDSLTYTQMRDTLVERLRRYDWVLQHPTIGPLLELIAAAESPEMFDRLWGAVMETVYADGNRVISW